MGARALARFRALFTRPFEALQQRWAPARLAPATREFFCAYPAAATTNAAQASGQAEYKTSKGNKPAVNSSLPCGFTSVLMPWTRRLWFQEATLSPLKALSDSPGEDSKPSWWLKPLTIRQKRSPAWDGALIGEPLHYSVAI
jgi:hypothetical protein